MNDIFDDEQDLECAARILQGAYRPKAVGLSLHELRQVVAFHDMGWHDTARRVFDDLWADPNH